jgi:hypothetical protein
MQNGFYDGNPQNGGKFISNKTTINVDELPDDAYFVAGDIIVHFVRVEGD